MQVYYEGAHSVLIKPRGSDDTHLVNLWERWGLVPSSCPVIAPPDVKTNTVEVYGANDVIDLTEFPRGFPIYGRRIGSLDFYVDGSDPAYDWAAVYTGIQQHLHGKQFDLILTDDPAYYYSGRLSVNDWKCDKNWSTISIDYDFAPYKLSRQTMLEDWEWNPFNFDTDIIPDIAQAHFKDIAVSGTKASTVFTPDLMGYMPFTPKFVLDSAYTGNFAMELEFRNNVPDDVDVDSNLSKYPYKSATVKFTNGATVSDNPSITFAATYPNTQCQIRYVTTKVSIVDQNPSDPFSFSIDFRQGRF